ncbi:uncharacterized protein LOC132749761 [Ruditapes philippinarum]|uniref:uncharacterized protein LOC132749761 n=1 Tax=Ruditapes philippinarum TaxID=129788 RepID=UPI00295AB997|nr:uncharacterized protein LOC132749761 [Ruditapes philippinarum]
MITPSKVLPHLRRKELIARCDMKKIEKISANCSNYAGAKLLLERLLENKKHHNWYVLFIEALQEAGMNEVAMDLQIPALLPGSAQNFTDTGTVNVNLDTSLMNNSFVTKNKEKDKRKKSRKESIQPNTLDKQSQKARDAALVKGRKGQMKTNYSDDTTEDESKCLEYREMVRIFKPLIVQNLLVHDILPSLPFLDNHDDIYGELKNRSEKSAVLILLDELENCQELGKWEKFISALSENGYSYIVDNIRGYKFINHDYQKQYIKNITPKIGYMITVCEILPLVSAKEVISESDKENIKREDVNHGNFAAAVLLLNRIHRKHRNWYLLFIEALNEAGMNDVVKCLEIPELLESKRTKDFEFYNENTYDERKDTPYSIPPSPKSTEYDTFSIQNVSGYEEYEMYVPPVPPRPPLSSKLCDYKIQGACLKQNKRRISNISDDNSTEYDTSLNQSVSGYEEYEMYVPPVPPKQSLTSKKCNYEIQGACLKQNKRSISNKSDDRAEGQLTNTLANVDDGLVKFFNASENVRLMAENEELKKVHNALAVQNSLLEQKFSMFADINKNIKERRVLLENIALEEKEKNALLAGPVASDDLETNDEANDFYPTSRTNGPAVDTHTGACAPIKQTFDYRDSILEEKYCQGIGSNVTFDHSSLVNIYHPHFDSRNKIVAMFDKDSGIGMDLN